MEVEFDLECSFWAVSFRVWRASFSQRFFRRRNCLWGSRERVWKEPAATCWLECRFRPWRRRVEESLWKSRDVTLRLRVSLIRDAVFFLEEESRWTLRVVSAETTSPGRMRL